MLLNVVAVKEVILLKAIKSLVKILGSFAMLEMDFCKIKEMCSCGIKAKMQAYG